MPPQKFKVNIIIIIIIIIYSYLLFMQGRHV